ncbi:hypothetical protein TI39_contig165g00001, partial [Zymoseptoria brevis]
SSIWCFGIASMCWSLLGSRSLHLWGSLQCCWLMSMVRKMARKIRKKTPQKMEG